LTDSPPRAPVSDPPAVASEHDGGDTPPPAPRRRRLVSVVGLAVAVLVAVVVAAVVFADGGSEKPSETGDPPDSRDALPSGTSTAEVPRELVLPPLGVYRGSSPAEVAEFEEWLGRPVPYALEFWGRDPHWAKIDDPSWVVDRWSESGRSVIYSIALLPSDRYTLEAGASGAYDQHWRSFGRTFVDRGAGDAILRLGWEFNGQFYPWAAGGEEEAFAAYWRRVVDVLRSIPGADFQFDWTALGGNTNADVEGAYPGDDYVDFIGLDAYDNSSVASSPEDRWIDIRDRTYGLAWHRDFAAAHGKPMTFPEWGLTVRSGDNLGGGDNAYFIERMHEWLSTNDVAYAAYFEFSARDAEHRLMTGDLPAGTEAFRRLFGR
jgi:hypothetical protein